MKIDPHPLRTTMTQPGDELYRVDVSEQTQERLRVRSQRAFPTARTTRGDSRWTWGRSVDWPSNSGAPVIFSPSDLEAGRPEEHPSYRSIDDVRRRLKR